jgi:hypothetical protein
VIINNNNTIEFDHMYIIIRVSLSTNNNKKTKEMKKISITNDEHTVVQLLGIQTDEMYCAKEIK